jgi:translation initiation factor IF-3
MIRVPQVRLVAADGTQVGVMDSKQALSEAEKAGLDLVEIAPNAKPPVCRIMDYGKYKYLMSKKAHESKKKQTIIHVKEVKLRVKTEEHDFQFKLRNAKRFLSAGDKVKVSIMFRGREITHTELGREMLRRVEEELREVGTVEQHPKLEGRNMTTIIAPIQHK